jgi:phosphopantothenoylcysteine decarboxylase/phosphopantothenate--cysteine ligase
MSEAAKTVVLGVGAGAASFKAVALASLLTRAGISVRVLMSEASQAYVLPLSFRAVGCREVVTTVTAVDADGVASHLKVAAAAALVVAPATADLIAKLVVGLAGDAVTLGALASPGLRFFCPAMNDHMWNNPIVQDNVRRLEQHGWRRIGPVFGRLAEGYAGDGRMSEPEEILEAVLSAIGVDAP